MEVQRNKAIVGRNAFAHEAGIHQDGMLKNPTTYEIMRPEDVGFKKTDLVLGKHSGRAALADRALALGYHLEGDKLQEVFEAFKKLADKKKEVYDSDIAALIEKRASSASDRWKLVRYELRLEADGIPSATVTLSRGDEKQTDTFFGGDGPLDALFRVIEKITGIQVVVRDYRVHSVSQGKDAQGESTIEVEYDGRVFRGRGVSTDTVEASTLAFLNATNRVLMSAGQPPQVSYRDTV
jgi:2-isopropylmalate synthase